MLTTGTAASTVYNYPDDGIQALKALRRLIFRTTATNAIPDLKRKIANWVIPSGKNPTSAFLLLRNMQRELAALLPSYDSETMLADIKAILPMDFALPSSLTPRDEEPDTLVTNRINHYESFLARANKRERVPATVGIRDDQHQQGGGRGGRGGRGNGRGGRGGRGGGRNGNNRNDHSNFNRTCFFH